MTDPLIGYLEKFPEVLKSVTKSWNVAEQLLVDIGSHKRLKQNLENWISWSYLISIGLLPYTVTFPVVILKMFCGYWNVTKETVLEVLHYSIIQKCNGLSVFHWIEKSDWNTLDKYIILSYDVFVKCIFKIRLEVKLIWRL